MKLTGDLSEEDFECLRSIIGGYLDLMSEHFARTKRGALRKSKSPSEDTPADRMLMGVAASCSGALKTINYMISQLKYDKNLASAWDRSVGRRVDEN